MKKLFLCLLCFLSLLLATERTNASEEEFVISVMKIARENITKAVVSDGSHVPVETEEEKKTPIIPVEDATRIIKVGQRSALAEWCQIEWEKTYYMGMMLNERAKMKWSDKQLAYMGLLHGITVGMLAGPMKQQGACSEEHAAKIKKVIDARLYN